MRKNAAFIRVRHLIIFLVVPTAFIQGRRLFELLRYLTPVTKCDFFWEKANLDSGNIYHNRKR